MTQPVAEPLPEDPSGPVTGDSAGLAEPLTSAEDEVMAELEESLDQAGDTRMFPYQAVVLLSEVAEHYLHLGGESPTNDQNRALLAALRAELDRRELSVPVLFGNRNSEPFLTDTLRQAHDEGMTRVLAVTTSAYSSYSSCRQYREDIAGAIDELATQGSTINVDKIRQYWNYPGFSRTNARLVTESARQLDLTAAPPHLVFVTHSLPTAMDDTSGPGDDDGNLYSTQHRQLAAAITAEASATLGVELQHDLTYCSRCSSPTQPWLEPDVNDHLRVLHERGVRTVLLVPIGFVSDHMEGAFDLDTEAMETAQELGIDLRRVPTVGIDTEFVMGLVDLVLERAAQARGEDVDTPTWPGTDARPAICRPGCCPNLQTHQPAACGSD